ncbi:MAG: hypothetical protein RSB50_09225 [Cetobacterium sp.]
MFFKRTFRTVDFYFCGEYHSSIEICMEDFSRIKQSRPNFQPWDFAHSTIHIDETTNGLYSWKINFLIEPIIVEHKIEIVY